MMVDRDKIRYCLKCGSAAWKVDGSIIESCPHVDKDGQVCGAPYFPEALVGHDQPSVTYVCPCHLTTACPEGGRFKSPEYRPMDFPGSDVLVPLVSELRP